MTRHKFAVGQEVEFSPKQRDLGIPPGVYRIVRQLPAEGNDWQYRVVNARDGHERIMHESQLIAKFDPWGPPEKTKLPR